MTTISAAATAMTGASRRTPAIRGALLLLFGLCETALLLVAFRLPDVTASVLVVIMVGFLLLDGLTIVFEVAGAMARRRRRLLRIGEAIVSIGAGVVIALAARGHALSVFAWWALLTGLLDLAEARAVRHRGTRLFIAVCSIVFGALLLWAAGGDLPVRVLGAGIYGIIVGALKLRAAVH